MITKPPIRTLLYEGNAGIEGTVHKPITLPSPPVKEFAALVHKTSNNHLAGDCLPGKLRRTEGSQGARPFLLGGVQLFLL
jgi:hypothetical protein